MKTRTLTNKRWLPLAIVPLFSVAILSGCSSSDDDDDNPGGGTAPVGVTDGNDDGIPDSFQVLDTLNANTDLVDANQDGIDDRDLNQDGLDDRDADGNGIADEFQTPVDPAVTATDSNGNGIDDSFESSVTGGVDENNDGIDDAAAAQLVAVGPTTTGGDTTGGDTTGGDTTGGDTTGGDTTGGDTTGGDTTGGDTGGGTTGGTTGGGTPSTGSIDGITFGTSTATADLSFDGSRLTGTVEAPDAVEVALFSGIPASAGNVQRIINFNGEGPTFFMPNPLSDQENAPILENLQSGSLFIQVISNTGEIIRSSQVLPPGNVILPIFTPLEVAVGSGLSSNGASFFNVNTATGQYTAVATVNIDVSDTDANENPISVAEANVHSGSPTGPVIVQLTMDTPTVFSATGTLSSADLQTILQNNGWFNITQNDGNTPGASFVTGQITP